MPSLEKIIFQHLLSAGGEPFITGGTVRDKLLGIPVRDTDVVVFGMDENMLRRELEHFDQVLKYGKSFRVFQVKGLAVEFSLPRMGNDQQKLSLWEMMKRDAEGRDFTVNALYMNPLSEEIKDPLEGLQDLEMRRLRMASNHTFEDDPLRVLRAVQLSARMGFSVEEKTMKGMRRVSLHSVANERIYEELNKWLLSFNPAKGWELLGKTGHTPEMCQTNKAFYTVIYEVLTCAASLRNQSANPVQWMWGVLLSVCMLSEHQQSPETDQREIRSRVIRQYAELSNHHDHTRFITEISWGIKNFQLYAERKADVLRLSLGVNLDELMLTITALAPFWSYIGRDSEVHQAMYRIKKWRPQEKIKPLVKGTDLKKWGFEQGKTMGVLLETAFQMQLEGVTEKQMEAYFKKYHKVLQNGGH